MARDHKSTAEELNDTAKVTHSSGANSSYKAPNFFLMPGNSIDLTAQRFEYGNDKYEDGNTVYNDANWLKAFYARDLQFFRDRAGHVKKHLWAEMRGHDDPAPGGNLGAIGWWLDVMAFIKDEDPYFYGALQGKYAYIPDKLADPPGAIPANQMPIRRSY